MFIPMSSLSPAQHNLGKADNYINLVIDHVDPQLI